VDKRLYTMGNYSRFIRPGYFRVYTNSELSTGVLVSAYKSEPENTETLEAGFFRCDTLPELSSGRSTKEQIEMCFEARKKNVFEAQFD